MLEIVFIFLVVLGFIFQFIGTWPVPPGIAAARWGWGCWMIASMIWALTSYHGGGGGK